MAVPLPVPDAEGIYTFPDDLVRAHQQWTDQLAERHRAHDYRIIELKAPHSGHPHFIEMRHPTGRPVLVVEPHHDDFALSASGTFLAHPRPLTVVTVFSRSTSVHPALENTYDTEADVSGLRNQEGAAALAPLAAARLLLGHKDADPPYRPCVQDQLERVTEELREVIAAHPDAELLAPAAVTRHPDHLLVREASVRLGCRWFWEDLAFWSTYALAGCDQHLFRARTGPAPVPELVDITGVVLDKVTVLRMHGSQMHPARKMYRPIRHAWTTAAGLLTGTGTYAERFYRTESP
ncbi:PIG-L deacetylase family protein [Streptomyces sp. NBC_01363]|uniref:PIG-L deacetylase family protein n=1 Tax=Streptomyces sp. NBC_01363 TaxID=2903840 RepID=UPI0022515146|nr:PIG-L family deacetylase [Streptomyces sp. NBC_01363]MCX4734958.1 PIG-L family deacetylase [Streptomyces sp. NBC_01363]